VSLNTFSIDYLIKVTAKTDTGNLRSHNEDSFAISTVPSEVSVQPNPLSCLLPPKGCILMIADGMGGAKAGELASKIAIESILNQFQEIVFLPENEEEVNLLLNNIISQAHEEIVAYVDSHKQFKGMGTTIVLLWILNEEAYISWCGDSRCYLFQTNHAPTLLTNDHSKVWELVKRGEITPEQARLHPQAHIITQALGDKRVPPKPDFIHLTIPPKSRLLLCSDGLNSMLSDLEIAQIVNNSTGSIEEISDLLITKAKEAGGKDNITVILAEINEQ
jgi:PPM family protein phosphatase